MTLFEYIAIAFSLVFSFTVVRLVGALPYVTRTDRIYWVHFAFLVTALLYVVNGFWAFWTYEAVTWTYARYVVALTHPVTLYFVSATLVPGEPAQVGSWRDHYFATRRRFFIGLGVLGLAATLTTTTLVSLPMLHSARLGEVGTLAVAAIGLASENPRVHGGLAVASLLSVAAFGAIVLARPGFLS
jgi:hypothetical protein